MSFSVRLFVVARSLGIGICCAVLGAACSSQGAGSPIGAGTLPNERAIPLPLAHPFQTGYQPGQRERHPNTSNEALLYVAADSYNGSAEILIYSQNGSNQEPIGEITQGLMPNAAILGLAVDNKRNLYVTEEHYGSDGDVVVYAPGQYVPSRTLVHAGAPTAIAVDGKGSVYVADSAGCKILEYLKGRTKPSTVVTFPQNECGNGVGVDSSGDLYICYNHYNREHWKTDGRVLEINKENSQGKDLGIRLGQCGALAVDKENNLIIDDESQGGAFRTRFRQFATYFFPAGQRKASKRIPFAQASSLWGVTIDSNESETWVTDPADDVVWGFTYPGGQQVDQIQPYPSYALGGVAATPALR